MLSGLGHPRSKMVALAAMHLWIYCTDSAQTRTGCCPHVCQAMRKRAAVLHVAQGITQFHPRSAERGRRAPRRAQGEPASARSACNRLGMRLASITRAGSSQLTHLSPSVRPTAEAATRSTATRQACCFASTSLRMLAMGFRRAAARATHLGSGRRPFASWAQGDDGTGKRRAGERLALSDDGMQCRKENAAQKRGSSHLQEVELVLSSVGLEGAEGRLEESDAGSSLMDCTADQGLPNELLCVASG